MNKNKAKIPLWAVSLGPIFILFIIYGLRSVLDLRDRPGAAGTLSIYRASPSTPPAKDWAADCIQWIHLSLNTSLGLSSSLVSLGAALCAVLGITAAGYAIDGRRGAMGAGLLGAVWPLTAYMGILDGIDPIAFGLSWLAVGCCWMAAKGSPWSVIIGIIGAAAAPFAISLKETAIPAVALCFLTPIFLRPSRWLLITIPAMAYAGYWAFSWFWPDQTTRLDIEFPDRSTLMHGWLRLKELPLRGLPEGKFDQFLIFGIICGCIPVGSWWRRLIIACASASAICFTAHTLDELVRPRYLATASIGILACCGAAMAQLMQFRNRLWSLPLIILLFLSLFDGWSFFHAWGEKRVEVTGAKQSIIPSPPTQWSNQYKKMTDLTLRDLTLWGGVRLAELVEQYPDGVAVPRLRDDRHRSLSGLAEIYGVPHVVLDPGNCCTGRPADEYCAVDIVEQLQNSGVTLAMPTTIKGVQRMNRFEERWGKALVSAMNAYPNIKTDRFWLVLEAEDLGGERPCQSKAPFRRPK
jgi:hypothetical protein